MTFLKIPLCLHTGAFVLRLVKTVSHSSLAAFTHQHTNLGRVASRLNLPNELSYALLELRSSAARIARLTRIIPLLTGANQCCMS